MGLFDGGTGFLGLGASLLGGLFGQSQTNEMQQQMMAQQQSFQEQMSNTAYQRASADMTKAGLNPMMMFSSGSAASTPAGASPSPNVKSGLDAGNISQALSTATQMKVADATIDNLVQQNAKIKAETLTEGAKPALLTSETMRTNAQTQTETERPALVRAEVPVMSAKGDILRNEAVTSKNEENMNPDARRYLDQIGYGGRKASDIVSPVGSIVSSAAHARRLFSDRFYY